MRTSKVFPYFGLLKDSGIHVCLILPTVLILLPNVSISILAWKDDS